MIDLSRTLSLGIAILISCFVFVQSPLAERLSSDRLPQFSKEEQRQLIQSLFQDQLFRGCEHFAEDYLLQFPEEPLNEDIAFFLVTSREKIGEDPEKILQGYAQFRNNYPESHWMKEVLLASGLLSLQQKHESEGVKLLTQWKGQFSQEDTVSVDYRVGKSLFLQAEEASERDQAQAQMLYQKVIETLQPIAETTKLSSEEQQNLWYLLAIAWYRRGPTQPDFYGLAWHFFQRWLMATPPNPETPVILFLKAETGYALYLRGAKESPVSLQAVVDSYQNYLKTRHNRYSALSKYRLGLLFDQVKQYTPALEWYQKYLAEKENDAADTVWLRMGRIYGERQQWTNALSAYQQVIQLTNTDPEKQTIRQEAQQASQTIKGLLLGKDLQRLVDKKSWKLLKNTILENLKNSEDLVTDEVIQLLIFAQIETKDWKGVLESYHLLQSRHSKSVLSLEALMNQAYASVQLKQWSPADAYYEQALQLVPPQENTNRFKIIEELSQIKIPQKNYASLVILYQQQYPLLTEQRYRIQLAYWIGLYSIQELQQQEQGVHWLKQADQGGIQQEELNALLLLASIYEEEDPPQAMVHLKKIINRLHSKKESFIEAHYRLARLYQSQEQWKEALDHYSQVAAAPSLKGYESYQNQSRQQVKAIQKFLKDTPSKSNPGKPTKKTVSSQPSPTKKSVRFRQ